MAHSNKKSGNYSTLSLVNGKWVVGKHDFNPPESDRPRTSPTSQDKQINPEAHATRVNDGSFHVHGVLKYKSGPYCSHELTTDCSICRRTLKIVAFGPTTMPEYAQKEACRLAWLEHLRTDIEHKVKRRSKVA